MFRHFLPPSAIALAVALAAAGCRANPSSPGPVGVSNPTDTAAVVGNLGVAFLNRFSAYTITPEQCLVDFTDSCRGKADEFSDITHNRDYFQIVGARLGAPTVTFNGAGTSATISMACSWDSKVKKCDAGTDCTVGAFGSIAGTCVMTAVREAANWKLCTSSFANGHAITPQTKGFFLN